MSGLSRIAVGGLSLAVLAAIVIDAREHVRYRRDLVRYADDLSRLDNDVRRLGVDVQRSVLSSVLSGRDQRAAPGPDFATNTARGEPVKGPVEAPAARAPIAIDWTAYEHAKSILDKALAGNEWTQTDANEFRVAALAAGGDKTIELMRMRTAAFNAQKIHGRFRP